MRVFGDSTYHVESHDWPVRLHRDDLTPDEIHGVLDAFDVFFSETVRGLKAVSVPESRSGRSPRGSAGHPDT